METELVPVIRFGEFEGAWERKTIGGITSKVGSGSTPKGGEKVYTEAGVPFIRSQNVVDDRLDLSDSAYISDEVHSSMLGSKVLPNDVLLNITGGSIGRSCVVPLNSEEANVNQHVCIIRPKNSFDSRLIQYFLTSHQGQKEIYRNITGSGREGLNFQGVRSFRIFLPTLPEQRKIASFLSLVDRRLAAARRRVALLGAFKRGVMQRIFMGPDSVSSLQNPNVRKLTLSQIARKVKTKNKNGAVTRVLTNSAVGGIIDQSDYFDKEIANQKNLGGYSVVMPGDFVYNPRISVSAPVGPVNRNNLGTGVMSPLYTVFRLKKGVEEFYEQFFQSTAWHKHMYSVANYGARHDRMNIRSEDFYSLLVPYPSLPEQTRIVNVLTKLDAQVALAERAVLGLEVWKRGLLQGMLV